MPTKKLLPENVQRLIVEYKASQERLIKLIAEQEARGNSTYYRKQILNGVNAELASLDEYAKKWTADEIPKAYQSGMNLSYEEYRKQSIPFDVIPPNNKAVQNIINNATGSLLDANQFVGRRIADDLRQAGLQAAASGIASGDTVKQVKANLMQIMSDRGIQSIVDKNGRAIELDVYASMVARSTTAESTNTGTMQAVADNGGDLVKITSHFSSCPICSVYEGRVYSITGNSKDYPPLSIAFKNGYNSLHPNCVHRAIPYVPEYDDNKEQIKNESNKPFKFDKKKEASVEAYQKDQLIKQKRREDRNEWQSALLLDRNNTPKTFSGYRALKRSDNEKYQKIKGKL